MQNGEEGQEGAADVSDAEVCFHLSTPLSFNILVSIFLSQRPSLPTFIIVHLYFMSPYGFFNFHLCRPM